MVTVPESAGVYVYHTELLTPAPPPSQVSLGSHEPTVAPVVLSSAGLYVTTLGGMTIALAHASFTGGEPPFGAAGSSSPDGSGIGGVPGRPASLTRPWLSNGPFGSNVLPTGSSDSHGSTGTARGAPAVANG